MRKMRKAMGKARTRRVDVLKIISTQPRTKMMREAIWYSRGVKV